MTEVCSICNRLLDDPKDPTTENCGGDCLRCMAEFAEDPDCVTPYIRILKTENKYLRHEVGAAKQELADFRQEVSDELIKQGFINASTGIGRFIIPAPKPDPLVDIMEKLDGEWTPNEYAKEIRSALDALGFEIREKGQ